MSYIRIPVIQKNGSKNGKGMGTGRKILVGLLICIIAGALIQMGGFYDFQPLINQFIEWIENLLGGGPLTVYIDVSATGYDGAGWNDLAVIVTVNGESWHTATPCTIPIGPFSSLTLSVPSAHGSYVFDRWSDGVTSNSRTVTVSFTGVTLQAEYSAGPVDPPLFSDGFESGLSTWSFTGQMNGLTPTTSSSTVRSGTYSLFCRTDITQAWANSFIARTIPRSSVNVRGYFYIQGFSAMEGPSDTGDRIYFIRLLDSNSEYLASIGVRFADGALRWTLAYRYDMADPSGWDHLESTSSVSVSPQWICLELEWSQQGEMVAYVNDVPVVTVSVAANVNSMQNVAVGIPSKPDTINAAKGYSVYVDDVVIDDAFIGRDLP